MEIGESSSWDSIIPSRYKIILQSNPETSNLKFYLHTEEIRIAVLDSPYHPKIPNLNPFPPLVAAMVVPRGLENDWLFSTEAGHYHILGRLGRAPGVSRLVLIGNSVSDEGGYGSYTRPPLDSESQSLSHLENLLRPFLTCFVTRTNQDLGFRYVRYQHDAVSSVVVERASGPVVGEFVVENIEIEALRCREFRRRIRFKRLPGFEQTMIKILPKDKSCLGPLRDIEFRGLESRYLGLGPAYLAPMVWSLAVIVDHLNRCRVVSKTRPRALCLGVAGGALLTYLASQLGFEVVGVEVDHEVLRVAQAHFGLEENEALTCLIADGMYYLKYMASNISKADLGLPKFDVIMVDMDHGADFRAEMSVPPLEFAQQSVLLAARTCLCDAGALVLNVISPHKTVYEGLKQRLKDVFSELYEIDTAGNGQNYVLLATMSRIDTPFFVRTEMFKLKAPPNVVNIRQV